MTFYKYFPTNQSIFLLVFLFTISANAFSGDTLSLGKHLKRDGFKPVFAVSVGGQSLVGYGEYGLSGRVYIPLPFGFRIAADYTKFRTNEPEFEKEAHISGSLQYPIFSHGRVCIYSSLGANIVRSETVKDYISTFFGQYIYNHKKGVDYYVNPQFGLGVELRINKTFNIYNEWISVNEWEMKTMLGVKINFLDCDKRKIKLPPLK